MFFKIRRTSAHSWDTEAPYLGAVCVVEGDDDTCTMPEWEIYVDSLDALMLMVRDSSTSHNGIIIAWRPGEKLPKIEIYDDWTE